MRTASVGSCVWMLGLRLVELCGKGWRYGPVEEGVPLRVGFEVSNFEIKKQKWFSLLLTQASKGMRKFTGAHCGPCAYFLGCVCVCARTRISRSRKHKHLLLSCSGQDSVCCVHLKGSWSTRRAALLLRPLQSSLQVSRGNQSPRMKSVWVHFYSLWSLLLIFTSKDSTDFQVRKRPSRRDRVQHWCENLQWMRVHLRGRDCSRSHALHLGVPMFLTSSVFYVYCRSEHCKIC